MEALQAWMSKVIHMFRRRGLPQASLTDPAAREDASDRYIVALQL
jgi:hypothetical protein